MNLCQIKLANDGGTITPPNIKAVVGAATKTAYELNVVSVAVAPEVNMNIQTIACSFLFLEKANLYPRHRHQKDDDRQHEQDDGPNIGAIQPGKCNYKLN
jgi:hypothetical protein